MLDGLTVYQPSSRQLFLFSFALLKQLNSFAKSNIVQHQQILRQFAVRYQKTIKGLINMFISSSTQ